MAGVQLTLLKELVNACKTNPSILHKPEMAFYREYLESLGATIPPPEATDEEKSTGQPGDEKMEEGVAEEQEEPEVEIPPPDIDNSGVLEADDDPLLSMGDPSRATSEENLEKANDFRDKANAAYSEGAYETAVGYYTNAIELNPGSAILHAKRANALLKMKKPVAAIRDCDHAISINPDSAAGYKFRGRANRLLGKWLEAHKHLAEIKDLAMGCKLDFDETAYEWLKEVEPNAKKLQEYQRAKERAEEEKKLKQQRERVRRAHEANKRTADEEEFDASEGAEFGMGGFNELFKELANDPELLRMMKDDPSLPGKLMEVMSNPQNMMKYMGDPAVMKLIGKLGAKFGTAGPPNFNFGGPAAGDGASPGAPPNAAGSDAPKTKSTVADEVD